MKTTTFTDLQLQHAIAKALKELIDTHFADCKCIVCTVYLTDKYDKFFHTDNKELVTPREWDWAVREVEKKLNSIDNILDNAGEETQLQSYICELERVVGSTCAEEDIFELTVLASWQQRATALVEIGVLEVV
jgi:hypothetical protein